MSFQKCNDGYILYICSNKISLIREVYQLKINGLKLIPSFIHLYHNGRQSWNYYKGRSFRSLLNLSCVYWHCSLGSWDSSFSYRIQRYQHVSIKSSMININVLSISLSRYDMNMYISSVKNRTSRELILELELETRF